MSTMIYFSVLTVLILGAVEGLFEGELCTKLDKEGVCVILNKCPSAQEEIKNKIFPKICSFVKSEPVVCCFHNVTPHNTKYEDIRPTFVGGEEVEVETKINAGIDPCRPLPEYFTVPTIGQKAWDKCIEYQQKLIFPCEKNQTIGKLYRKQQCPKIVRKDSFGVVGTNIEDAEEFEFAHMALLGYGKTVNTSKWLCGGSVISERFILTAGHCHYAADWGYVTRVALGIHKRSEVNEKSQIYDVKQIIKHPDFKPPMKYNDIALLELIQEIKLSQFIVPACLYTKMHNYDTKKAVATRWGVIWYKGPRTDVLQKLTLQKYNDNSCILDYGVHRYFPDGINGTTQLCYGDTEETADTCDGDSGGPLQLEHPHMYCMYIIIGVTSFGKRCGVVKQESVYTGVLPYISWIEGIVWK